MEVRARVNKALESVYGVDVNPFATAIAMFRLIVAALKQTGDRSLVNAPAFTLNLASGDSLFMVRMHWGVPVSTTGMSPSTKTPRHRGSPTGLRTCRNFGASWRRDSTTWWSATRHTSP